MQSKVYTKREGEGRGRGGRGEKRGRGGRGGRGGGGGGGEKRGRGRGRGEEGERGERERMGGDLQELSSLGEPHDIEPVLEHGVGRQVFAHLSDLVVGIHEKSIQRVLHKVITNLKGLDIDPRHLLFH